jgi:hypothetical protein
LVSIVTAETKKQSKQWIHTYLPNKMKKFKQTSDTKLMVQCQKLTSGVVLLLDNAHLHTTAHIQALLWSISTGCCLTTFLVALSNKLVEITVLNNNKMLVEVVKVWHSSQAANFFVTGIQKLIPRFQQ